MTITICICTKNRPQLLKKCIQSILNGKVLPNEIIIINEGKKLNNKLIPKNAAPKIKIIDYPNSNLSKGRNLAIKSATSDIIGFTDDDCVVDFLWTQICVKTFLANKSLMSIFGSTKPYQPKKHKGQICPCIFESKKQITITTPCYHATNIGFGNNMAFRKIIFKKVGVFKNWLGAGSIAQSAEDAEFALRVLLSNYKIYHNSKMIIYHDRWLNQYHFDNLMLSYRLGEISCYGYFYFSGYKFSRNILINNLKEFKKRVVDNSTDIIYTIKEIQLFIKGFFIALYFSKKDPVVFKKRLT